MSHADDLEARIAAVRRFSRFYTRQLGLLRESLVRHALLAHRGARALRAGASRAGDGERARRRPRPRPRLSQPHPAPLRRGGPARRRCARRTTAARASSPSRRRAARRSRRSTRARTTRSPRCSAALSDAEQARVVGAMASSKRCSAHERTRCRRSCCGRIGPATWAGSPRRTARSTRRNTAGTSPSRRWSRKITAEFIENFDPAARALLDRRDRRRARRLGVRGRARPTTIAKLRLLIIDPKARGLGLGKRLVEECLRFAKDAGYTSMTLWTQSISDRGARHLRSAPDSSWSPRSRTIRSASISSAKPGNARSLNRTALGGARRRGTGVQVGAAITATRYVAADISPASLAFLRYAIGVACLVPAVALARRVRFARADILPIAAARHRPVRHPDRAVELRPAHRAGRARRADLRELPAADARSRAHCSAMSVSRSRRSAASSDAERRRSRARRQDRRQRARSPANSRSWRAPRPARSAACSTGRICGATRRCRSAPSRWRRPPSRCFRAGGARRPVRRAGAAFASAPGRRSCSSGSRPARSMWCGCGR